MAFARILAAGISLCALAACGGKPASDGATAEAKPAEAAAPVITSAEVAPPTGTPTQPSAAAQAPTVPPPPPADPLAVGSKEAKDDLYCSAVIMEANPDPDGALAPIDEALLRKAQMLGFAIGEAGINLIVTEKAAHATHAAIIKDAYAAQVEKDIKKGKPRISLDACNKRAAALPFPQ